MNSNKDINDNRAIKYTFYHVYLIHFVILEQENICE